MSSCKADALAPSSSANLGSSETQNACRTKGELWILIDSLTYGGIETHVVELANGLKQFNQQVRVVLLARYGKPSAIIDKLKALDIPYSYVEDLYTQSVNAVTVHSNKPLPSPLKQLLISIRTFQPSVVHAHGYKASIFSKLCKLMLGSSFSQLTTFHAGETPVGRVKWYDRLDRYSAFLSDQRLSVSQTIQSKVPAKSHVLNNFITMPDLVSESQTGTTRQHVAFVGRLSHEKGPDRFIKLAQEHLEVTFTLYGDGDMRDELTSLASDNVRFAGFQTNMAQCWGEIDLLVITSRFEGLPMTAIEAMARGIPILSLNVGAIVNLIEDQKNGWIASDMSSLSTKLQSYLSLSQNELNIIQRSARNTVSSNFSTEAVIPQVLKLYHS
ncbi:glycosyltransferase family 4 protein [Vibrio maerlii]|uniref:glycosyltransferase family 4 protein n=1 Tax=Vibrio maerlii TaxID=2231648 RepID=UPI000E3C3C91|nr:glycosyltransferase family 4 protein [Vibrio maerlii]